MQLQITGWDVDIGAFYRVNSLIVLRGNIRSIMVSYFMSIARMAALISILFVYPAYLSYHYLEAQDDCYTVS